MTNCMYDILNKVANYNNIGFDLDDTIYRRNDYDYSIYYRFFQHQNMDDNLSSYYANELLSLRKEKGDDYPCLFDDLIKMYDLKFSIDDFLKFYKYPPIIDVEDKIVLKDLIVFLHSLKRTIFLITNGYFITQMNKIFALNIQKYFNQIIILSPEFGLPLKPDPSVKKILRLSGSTIYIGDKESDEIFAKNCGFDFYKINLK